MFLPGNPGRKLLRPVLGTRDKRGPVLLGLYGMTLVAAIGVAFALRTYAEDQLTEVWGKGLAAVAMSPINRETLNQTINRVVQSSEVEGLLQKYHAHPGHTLVAYVLPQNYMMQHLIADLDEHKAHHGEGEQGGFLSVIQHLGEMYALKPLRQLRDGAGEAAQRVIFTEALDPSRENVALGDALGISVQRYPLFFADFDAQAGHVTLTMETPRRHTWGTIPVPAF